MISTFSSILWDGLTSIGELISAAVDRVPNCGNVELFPPVFDQSFFVKWPEVLNASGFFVSLTVFLILSAIDILPSLNPFS